MKLKILIAVYNDWSSLDILLTEINKNLQFTEWKDYKVYIVNDASTIEIPEKIRRKTKIINLFNNIVNPLLIVLVSTKYLLFHQYRFD